MKKKLLCFLIITLFIASMYSVIGISLDIENKVGDNALLLCWQNPSEINPTFTRTWGTPQDDFARHGMIFEGYIYSCGYCNYVSSYYGSDIYLLKYDTSGSLIWNKTWHSELDDGVKYVTANKGYIYVAGYTTTSTTGFDMFLLKYDTDGNLIWEKTWGGNENDIAYASAIYGNYIYIIGGTRSYGSEGEDVFLLKYDTDGNFIWETTWGKTEDEYGHGIAVHNDYIYVTGNAGYTSAFLLKYDTDGNFIYEKRWSEGEQTWGNALIIRDENIYITGGTGDWFNTQVFDILVLKCDMDGNTQWLKKWNGGEGINCGYQLTIYNEYLYICGRQSDTGSTANVVLLKYDLNGELLWAKTWGEHKTHEYVRSVDVYNDFIYMSGGIAMENEIDVLLLKCDLEGKPGNINPNKPETPSGPSKGKVGNEITYSISTIDLDGEKVKFLFDWGEGNTTWTNWINSGVAVSASHTWNIEGNYEIRVKARDEKGGEGEWSDPLSVTMPKSKPYINTPFQWFLQQHLLIYHLLQRLLKL